MHVGQCWHGTEGCPIEECWQGTGGCPFEECWHRTGGCPFEECWHGTEGCPIEECWHGTGGCPFEESWHRTGGCPFEETLGRFISVIQCHKLGMYQTSFFLTNRYRFKNVVRRLLLGKEWDYISKSTDLYKLIDRYLCVLSADRTAPVKDISRM